MRPLYSNFLTLDKKKIILPILLVVLSFLVFSFNLEGQGWFRDEPLFLAGGGVYFNLIIEGKLFHPCWTEIENCDLLHRVSWEWPIHTGHVKHYFIGLGQHILGIQNDSYYEWSCAISKCDVSGIIPTPNELAVGRFFSPIFGSLTILLSYLIGNFLFNRTVGLLASLILLFHSLWLWNSRVALTEVYLMFFILLTILLLIYSFRTPKNTKISYFVAAAITFGIAFNIKLTVIQIVPLLLFLIFLKAPKNDIFNISTLLNKTILKKSFLLCLIFFTITLITIFITNPYYYTNPFEQLFELREGTTNYFQLTPPSIENDNIFRSLITFHTTIIPYFIDYYPFNSSEDLQRLSTELSIINPLNYSSIPLSLFFIIGSYYIFKKIKKKEVKHSETILLFWYLTTFVFISLTVRGYNAERFFLPLFFPMILIASYGLWIFSNKIKNTAIKISFSGIFLLCHSFFILIFWEFIYFYPEIVWYNPIAISMQHAFKNQVIIIFSILFSLSFLMIIFYKMKLIMKK